MRAMLGSSRLCGFALGAVLALASPVLGQDAIPDSDKPPTEQPVIESPRVPPPIAPSESGSEIHAGERQSEEHPQPEKPPGTAENVGIWGIWGDTPAQWVMAVFGIVTTGVSIWAVWLLRQTLRATRDAVTEAREATKAAQDTARIAEKSFFTESRPLMVFEGVTELHVNPDADPPWVNMKLTARNVGKTAAVHVGFALRTLHEPAWSDPGLSMGLAEEQIQIRENTSKIVEQMTAANHTATDRVSTEFRGRAERIIVLYLVCYKSVISDTDKWLYTIQSGTIRWDDERGEFRLVVDSQSNLYK